MDATLLALSRTTQHETAMTQHALLRALVRTCTSHHLHATRNLFRRVRVRDHLGAVARRTKLTSLRSRIPPRPELSTVGTRAVLVYFFRRCNHRVYTRSGPAAGVQLENGLSACDVGSTFELRTLRREAHLFADFGSVLAAASVGTSRLLAPSVDRCTVAMRPFGFRAPILCPDTRAQNESARHHDLEGVHFDPDFRGKCLQNALCVI